MATGYDINTRTLQMEPSELIDKVRDEAAICAAKRIAADPTAYDRIATTIPEESYITPHLTEGAHQLAATAFGRYTTGEDGIAVTLPTNADYNILASASAECDAAMVSYALAKWYELTMPDMASAKMDEYARHVRNVQFLLSKRKAPSYSKPSTWSTSATVFE